MEKSKINQMESRKIMEKTMKPKVYSLNRLIKTHWGRRRINQK